MKLCARSFAFRSSHRRVSAAMAAACSALRCESEDASTVKGGGGTSGWDIALSPPDKSESSRCLVGTHQREMIHSPEPNGGEEGRLIGQKERKSHLGLQLRIRGAGSLLMLYASGRFH